MSAYNIQIQVCTARLLGYRVIEPNDFEYFYPHVVDPKGKDVLRYFGSEDDPDRIIAIRYIRSLDDAYVGIHMSENYGISLPK